MKNQKKKPVSAGKEAVSEGMLIPSQEVIHRPPDELKPYPGNARIHDEKQMTALMAAIREFGFQGAILINEDDIVLAGHGRLDAVKRLKLKTVPTMVVAGLTKAQQKAYVLADNKLSQMSRWDHELLRNEIELLLEDDFQIETTGFSTAEIDLIVENPPEPEANNPDDLQPQDVPETIITSPGDIWILGKHRLICGDSLKMETYAHLMEGKEAELVITDPPYNVPIQGHVCGSGKTKHDEFAMAAGEMDSGQFTEFLETAFSLTGEFMKDGGLIFSFMDWRHQREILNAAEPVFGPLRQLCVWTKDNGGMGTFYRSQHELVFIFRKGDKAHINNFGLGQHGRYRTNVWQYPGVNTFGGGHDLLKLHPTVKPVSMIADALRDCSHRNGLVLDPFAGSGTILIAAERTGRCARAIEYEPKYVDVAINRWERVTGENAIHLTSGASYSELKHIKKTQENTHV